MKFLDLTLDGIHENLALDEALLLEAEAGNQGELLRIWEWRQYAVVLGAAGIVQDDVHQLTCFKNSIPLARRASGGGTVLLGQGSLQYSLILSYQRAEELTLISPSYRFIAEHSWRALQDEIGEISLNGSSDLVWHGKKFSGNAQQRKRQFLLHHGTLLYDFDIFRISNYLTLPPRRPEYRQSRKHEDFLTNLPVTRQKLIDTLVVSWQAHDVIHNWPQAKVNELVRDKYDTDQWIFRR